MRFLGRPCASHSLACCERATLKGEAARWRVISRASIVRASEKLAELVLRLTGTMRGRHRGME